MSFLVTVTQPFAGNLAVRSYPGYGILGADIPLTGDHGASPVANDGISPTAEYHWRIESPPSAGVLAIYPDLTFTHDGNGIPAGTYSWTYRLFENNSNAGTATVSDSFGSVIMADITEIGSDSVAIQGTVSAMPSTGSAALTESSTDLLTGLGVLRTPEGSLALTESLTDDAIVSANIAISGQTAFFDGSGDILAANGIVFTPTENTPIIPVKRTLQIIRG